MTEKQIILAVLQRMPENVTFDDVIDRLCLIQKIEIAQGQADRREGIEHDELMHKVLRPVGTE
jgi:hypothetical protein